MESFLDYLYIDKSPIGDGTYVEYLFYKHGIQYTVEVKQDDELNGNVQFKRTDGSSAAEAVFDHGRMKSFTEYDGNKMICYFSSDGMRNGFYVEYDEDDYLNEKGDIREGVRVVRIKSCPNKRGYYLVYDPDTESLIAVASMDRKCEMKNGKYYEIDNGKVVKVCMYTNNARSSSLDLEPVEDDDGNVLYSAKMSRNDYTDEFSDDLCNRSSHWTSSIPPVNPAAGIAIAGGALAIGGAIAYWLAHRNKDDDSDR